MTNRSPWVCNIQERTSSNHRARGFAQLKFEALSINLSISIKALRADSFTSSASFNQAFTLSGSWSMILNALETSISIVIPNSATLKIIAWIWISKLIAISQINAFSLEWKEWSSTDVAIVSIIAIDTISV